VCNNYSARAFVKIRKSLVVTGDQWRFVEIAGCSTGVPRGVTCIAQRVSKNFVVVA